MKIKYIGYYNNPDNSERRNGTPSGKDKMDYIAKALSQIGYEVDIVSMSSSIETSLKRIPSHYINISESINLTLFSSFGTSNKFLKLVRLLWQYIIFVVYLLRNTHKGEVIIVYHSLLYYYSILLIQKIKQLKVILEVEEIYCDVKERSALIRRMEKRMLDSANGYIFSTELLQEKVNHHNKLYAVVYGRYLNEIKPIKKFEDDKIHIVYAGTFDKRKGVYDAVDAAEYIKNNYIIHICGYGSKNEVDEIESYINEKMKFVDGRLSYEGLLLGDQYTNFIQKCHIGLCTQDPSASFTITSFPSKVLSYISNGLSVVSIEIESIRRSKVGSVVNFYKDQNPKEIANTIMGCKLSDDRGLLVELDIDFKEKIKSVISRL